ncbi:lytic transglycosylase [Streptomyces hygroscopicus]|uniref:lytic transglycosylase domain-containing protein n=1 Tax=Streptomyces hygroscopicus TaxID=1912 RepID=UPI0022400CE2|nr:lytic transglycosylase domain-containing protein [Streptomyces hygroscopicus]MCW7943133.1 lytic transglycosylase [Streptomyces hygroscopicus]
MAAQIGRRLRKGAATTAVAAAAVAALTASQAPGATIDDQNRRATGAQATPDATGNGDGTATGNGGYYTDLPPLNSPTGTPSPSAGPATGAIGTGEAGLPATVLDAYKKAAAELGRSKPGCNLPWQLLAAIGQVESGQADGGRVDANGTTYSKILGPVLDGNGFAAIKDTDHGAYDGDTTYDRAVGPMQFIPSTWAWAGRDGNGDGVKDPNNIYDAALAAAHYLCRSDRDLSVQADMNEAVLGYNNSQDYLNTVLSWYEYYRKGTHSIPDGTGTAPSHRSDDNSGANPVPTPPVPQKTKKPGTHKPDSGPTPGTTPGPTPPPGKPAPSPTPPTPTDTVDHLADGGTGRLSAMAGHTFAQKIVVKAVTKDGKSVPKVRVRFMITGDTDATFTGGETVATVVSDNMGKATAPALAAGEKTGDFKVRALVVGRTVTGLDYPVTVTERRADTLARTSDTELTCTPGGEFADQVEVKATYKGAVADGVAATATLVKSADDPTENDKGPYFKDADSKTVRTLTGLKTDAKGLLKLPKLYADSTTGTFLLRITTAGGATLTVELKVAAAAPPASPSPSPTPSPSA